MAEAILERDRGLAEGALKRARGIDELSGHFLETVIASREMTRFAPPGVACAAAWSASRPSPPRSISPSATSACWRAGRSARSGSTRMSRPRSPTRCASSRRRCGRSPTRSKRTRKLERVREHALRAAATATHVLEGTGNLSVSVIVGQVRSTATDLVAGTGMDTDDAVEAVSRALDEGQERTGV